jgi:hypothetical protein
MQRLRQREWNAAKTDAKGVTSGVKTEGRQDRRETRRGGGSKPESTGTGTGTK